MRTTVQTWATPAKVNGNGQGESRRSRILLVDDDESVRQLLTLVLERAGFDVLAASRGQEALVTLQNSSALIDLLLTDIDMPGMTGVELARLAGQMSPGMPVLLISGTPAAAAIVGSGWDFLPKPFVPDVLISLVKGILASDRAVR